MAHVLEELLINEPWYDVLSDMSELSEPTAKANKKGKGKVCASPHSCAMLAAQSPPEHQAVHRLLLLAFSMYAG